MTRQQKSAAQDLTTSRSPSPQSTDQRKRRKIAQACEQCRARKGRCDGSKPVCGECASRPNQRAQCRYSSNNDKNKSYDDYVASLLLRIQELEARQEQNLSSATPSQSQPQPHIEHLEHNTQHILTSSNGFLSAQLSLPDAQIPETSPVGANSVDAMGAADSVSHTGQEQDSAYYGGSSTISLMQQVYSTIGSNVEFSRASSPFSRLKQLNASRDHGHPWNAGTSLEQFSLLPRSLTDTILAVYWNKIHHLYPFVHKPTFMTAYERLWMSQSVTDTYDSTEVAILGSKAYGSENYIFHCALNSMLALAIQFMDPPSSDRARLANVFAARARGLCKLDLFDDGSLASIQALLLMTMYLQSSTFPNRCWNCIGVTCRLAQGLGLHIESPQLLAKLTPLEVEMRRRIWHGCTMLDTIVSTTLGRPMMLYKFGQVPVPLPLPVDDDYLHEPDTQPPTHVPWARFYVESVKMHQLLADVITHVYGTTNLRPGFGEKEVGFDEITNLDSAISKLENDLPEHLRPAVRLSTAPDPQYPDVFKQQAFVLRARYLHVRVLLYRPIFLRHWHRLFAQEVASLSDPRQDSSLSKVVLLVAQSLSSACVEHCANLIELIRHNLEKSTTGAWWYNLFYLRTAGIIIVLALTCTAIGDDFGKERLETVWDNCQAVLGHLQNFSATVLQCLKQLTRLYRHLLDSKIRQANREAYHGHGAAAADLAVSEENVAFQSHDERPTFGETFDIGSEYEQMLWGVDTTIFDGILRYDYGNFAPSSFDIG